MTPVEKVFRTVQASKEDLKALRADPPTFKPGQDDSALLRLAGKIVKNMEREAVELLRDAEPATDKIQ